MNNLREIIYAMKMVFGTPIDLYTESAPVLNPETGRNDITISKIHIRRAVVPTAALYNLISQVGNVNAKFGKNQGIMDTDLADFVIDSHDVITDISLTNYIDYDGERYDVDRVMQLHRFERTYGWFLSARKTRTELLNKIGDYILNDMLTFAEVWIPYLNVPYPTEFILGDELELLDEFVLS